MNDQVWNIPRAAAIPQELIQAGYTPLLAAVLASRGVATAEAAAAFTGGAAQALEDPFRLTDMRAAVDRIERARQDNETVAVYGDYDVDGITSACLLTEYLRGIGLNTELYIPDRIAEGYGLNNDAIRRLREKNVTLIITVDCGITAVEETDYAASLGVDMIITDHHECQAALPAAVAVVDPKRPDCAFCGRELAGVGVAFKLVCALSGDETAMLRRYADLVAVGTIADVMPLVDENREITRIGLDKLRRDPRPGLAALLAEAGVADRPITATTVGFALAPRINAAGRLGRVFRAADLLLERDQATARRLAAELCNMNRERQRLEAEIWRQAERMLAGRKPDGPIVLAGEGWHQGVIGIAASRLSETYAVPAVMISLEGDRGKGSCRSYGGFNLFDALSACGGLLEAFGGHALAAGLNITRQNIDAFREAFTACYKAHPPTETEGVNPDILIDDPGLLSLECVESLDVLEPCGAGNPRPSFCLTDVRLVSVTSIGGGRHTSLRFEKFGVVYEAVWFSRRAETIAARPGDMTDIVFFPQVSDYRGRRSVQLLMQALRRTNPGIVCRRVLDGGDAPGLRMNRRELAVLWRRLTVSCPARLSVSALGTLEPSLHPAKVALGLRVLSEVSLASLQDADDELTITLTLREGKADLMQSSAWRRYHEQEGRYD